ncbi:FHA domain protein [Gemmata sp. SH-PL17]|uniref:FHA domain-containing protein n=1 Tax=Gemmata sp. SH-PL17 TaxID=1630693 RepID=UPI0004B9FA88|nr:FHA domain-containing protein [Gemmata sp. SH-PL17]AMV23460.1 FHA domain protein [Gemmata sp. SH-PL17]
MKVSLVVAAGAHEGRAIPLTGAQFLIGRDQQCHLRPASPAISKVHCAVLIRDGKVYVKDCGSTNGTLVNYELIQSKEVEIQDGAALQVGPLDFRVRIARNAPQTDGTPLPGGSAETAAALAAVKAATAATAPKAPVRDTTPAPAKSGVTAPGAPKSVPATKPAPSKETPAPKPPSKESPALTTSSETTSDDDHDRIAAMLLGMDDDGNGNVPEGSTVMEMPSPLAGTGEGSKVEEKKDPKKVQSREDMTNAANDLLRQYMRRPK